VNCLQNVRMCKVAPVTSARHVIRLQMEELEFIYGRYLQMYWQPARGMAFRHEKWARGLNLAIKIIVL